MNDQIDFTVKAESEDFKNALFLAMELSRATWTQGPPKYFLGLLRPEAAIRRGARTTRWAKS